MIQNMKYSKGLDSSFVLLSNRSAVSPLASQKIDLSSYFERPISPSKILQKSKHYSNKSQAFLYDQQKKPNKTNDYVKKLIFDNQQLNNRLKQLTRNNVLLQKSKQQAISKYDDIKQSFLQLKQLYQTMMKQNGIKMKETYRLGNKKKQLSLFGKLCKDILNLTNETTKQQMIQTRDQNKQSPSNLFILIPSEQKKKERKESSYSFNRAESLHICEVSIQTDQQCSILSLHNEQLYGLSPSSNEAQLILKISQMQQIIKQLQNKIMLLNTKYDNIKSILIGEVKIE